MSSGTERFPLIGGRFGGGCCCGRRGMPADWIEQMYADYRRLGSLSKVAKAYGRTRQNMWDIFKRRGLKLNSRNFLPVVEYKGMKFTLQKTSRRGRYYRETTRRDKTVYLHHLIWEEHNGPIPPGHKIIFKDRNQANISPDNLQCVTAAEQQQHRGIGANQFTTTAGSRLKSLLAGATVSSKLKRRAA